MKTEFEMTVEDVLGTLTETERDIVTALFWDGMKLREAAASCNITTGAAGRVWEKARRKLNHPDRSRLLRNFMR